MGAIMDVKTEKLSFGHLLPTSELRNLFSEGKSVLVELNMGNHSAFATAVWRMSDDEDKSLDCQRRLRRILDCVNAFQDVPTDTLNRIIERGGVKVLLRRMK